MDLQIRQFMAGEGWEARVSESRREGIFGHILDQGSDRFQMSDATPKRSTTIKSDEAGSGGPQRPGIVISIDSQSAALRHSMLYREAGGFQQLASVLGGQ